MIALTVVGGLTGLLGAVACLGRAGTGRARCTNGVCIEVVVSGRSYFVTWGHSR